MDRVKAIKVLKPLVNSFVDYANITMKEEDDDTAEALEMAIEALKAQLSQEDTTKDAISRQAVLDAIVQCTNCGDEDTLREYVLKHSLDNGWTGGILEALDAVKDLPSAQPEPKEGHWIEGGIYRDVIECYCSECGQLMTTAATVRMNYCPNCGAKMRGEQNGRTD